jgi:hypothetical protein
MPLGAAIESVLGGPLYLTENKPLHKVIREDLTEAEREEHLPLTMPCGLLSKTQNHIT